MGTLSWLAGQAAISSLLLGYLKHHQIIQCAPILARPPSRLPMTDAHSKLTPLQLHTEVLKRRCGPPRFSADHIPDSSARRVFLTAVSLGSPSRMG